MPIWLTLLLFAGTLLISELTRPKPNVENARPAGLGDFQFPTSTRGRPIPLVWGTVLIKGPNVVWYGDLVKTALRQTQRTGLFSKETVTTGFEYSLGIQLAFCLGSGDQPWDVKFLRLFVGEEEFANSDGSNPLGSGITSGTVALDNADFFGGNNLGQGGIVGNVTLRPGSRSQSIPSYLSTHQLIHGATPRYPDVAYALLERVTVGTSTQIQPWWAEVQRMPNPLGLSNNTVNSGLDLNPISMIAEILTNTDWGYSQPLSKLNVSSLQDAAETLRTEGNGISYVLDRKMDASELLRYIEKQIDGVIYKDRRTGLWEVNLARVTDSSVLSLDESNVLQIESFTRAAFADTSNEVFVSFANRALDYGDDYGHQQDIGNITQRGGEVVTETIQYSGVKDSTLANAIADRDLLGFSYPLAKATVLVNREGWDLNPADVVEWSNQNLGLDAAEFRVNRIGYGTILDGKIRLDLVQNVFAIGSPSFAPPDGGSWTPPASGLQAYDADSPPQAVIFEAPRAFVERDPDSPGIHPRVWFGARNKGDGAVVCDLVTGDGVRATAGAFFLMGTLSADLAQDGGESTFEIAAGADTISAIAAVLRDITKADVGSGLDQILLIGDEFVGADQITVLGSTVRIDGGYRGLLDSVPSAHSSGDPVYLIYVGGSLSDGAEVSDTFEVITEGFDGERLDSADAYSEALTLGSRFNRPYPPARVEINGSAFPTSLDWDTTQTGIPFDERGVLVECVRRDFRLADEIAKHEDESALPSDFPSANTTEYRLVLDPDTGSTRTGAWAAAASSIAVSRAEAIWDFDDNPASIDLSLEVRHTVDASVISGPSTDTTFTIAGDTAGKTYLGRMDNGDVESFTAPESGTYSFDIGADLLNGGIVEAQINGGGYVTVISSGNSSGTLAGVTASDTIDVRHTGVNGNAVFALLLIDPPTATGYLAPLRV